MKTTRKTRPTLYDVAKAAGVGSTTVSRVINDAFYVRPAMRDRVLKAMAQLKYQPNQFARSLKSEHSGTIGLIVPSIIDPFFAHFASSMETYTRKKDTILISLTSSDNAMRQEEDLRIFERYRIDGLVIVPPRSGLSTIADSVQRLSIPVVTFDRPLPHHQYSSVVTDNFSAAENAVAHLLTHNRKKILCLGGDPNLYTIRERVKGYNKAVAVASLPSLVEMEARTYKVAEAAILKHMGGAQKLDAIFGLYSQATILAYEVLQNHNFAIPEDVSLIGFDDFELATLLKPPISVINQSVDEMARVVTNLLVEQIENKTMTLHQVEIGASLLIRGSCGCPTEAKNL